MVFKPTCTLAKADWSVAVADDKCGLTRLQSADAYIHGPSCAFGSWCTAGFNFNRNVAAGLEFHFKFKLIQSGWPSVAIAALFAISKSLQFSKPRSILIGKIIHNTRQLFTVY